MNAGWADGVALFKPLAPPPRPREARCADCHIDLLYLEPAPPGPHHCSSCRPSTTPTPA